MKRALPYVAGAVTLTLLYLAARNVHPDQLWKALSEADPFWVAAMIAIGLLDLLIRAWRWRVLLSRSRPGAPVPALFRLEAIGLAVNNVVPLRIGELARGFLASRELGVPAATALASVAVERALDVAALLSLFCLAAAGAPEHVPDVVRRLALLAVGGAYAALVVLAVAEGPLEPGGALEKRLRPWPRLHDLVSQLAAGAAVLRSPRPAALAAALSLALWGVDAGLYWCGARALGIGAHMSYPQAVLVLSWAGAAAVLPAAPGSFGAFEAAVKNIVVSLGVDPHRAFAYAVFNHMIMYVVVTTLGLAFLWRVGLSLGELKRALEKKP